MTSERWRVIAAFPDYAVSNLGRVRRVTADQKGRLSGEPMKASPDSDGYLKVTLFADAKGFPKAVHAVVCEAFHGARPTGYQVAHRDGSRTNNHEGNLRWVTAKENADDREMHGRTVRGDQHPSRIRPGYLPAGDDHWSRRFPEQVAKGERHNQAKLTIAEVTLIRSDRRLLREIAAEFGVTPSNVCAIKGRKTWRHVP